MLEQATEAKSVSRMTDEVLVTRVGESAMVDEEGETTAIGRTLFRLYARVEHPEPRYWIRSLLVRFEPPEVSPTLRRIYRDFHGVEVGVHTTAGAFIPGAFRPGTSFGRYCSVAWTAAAVGSGRPTIGPGTFRSGGEVEPLDIGHDVWLGHNSVILPSVRTIGTGAVVGAGSVVQKDVPPYAVVVGNPARVVRYRFEESRIAELLEERWWERPLADVSPNIDEFAPPTMCSSA